MKMQGPNPQGTGISQRIITFTPINTQYLDWEVQEGPSESSDKHGIITLTLLACETRLPRRAKGPNKMQISPSAEVTWLLGQTEGGSGHEVRVGMRRQDGPRAPRDGEQPRGGRRKGSSGR